MTTFAELMATGLDERAAAAQIVKETAMQPGDYARARHVLATRIVETFDSPETPESEATVILFRASLEGLETAEAAGIAAEHLAAAMPALIDAASEDVAEA